MRARSAGAPFVAREGQEKRQSLPGPGGGWRKEEEGCIRRRAPHDGRGSRPGGGYLPH
ncbi:Hypothetical predicted protein [Podarcis lilfordi]|uniref:Uncharacterized protein n=1 Tax=Podarcis lilfordi TaxID=74358 RepID=A0AA35P4I3_9SAUR|nr:Hypothetical predicted protein [Podarcis lilfordi]